MPIDQTASVIGIGACTVDYIFVVDELPKFGIVNYSSNYERQLGGAVTTAMIALERFGVPTQLISTVGSDTEAEFILSELKRKNFSTNCLEVDELGISRIILVLVDRASGERCFTCRPEVLKPLELSIEHKRLIQSARVLYVNEASESTIQAARWAREADVLVVFDGGWVSSSIDELLELVDIPIVSKEFASEWMPHSAFDHVIAKLFEFQEELVVLTLGEKGCIVQTKQDKKKFPAFHINALDTTGAGDAFRAGFIYGLLQEWQTNEIVSFASAAAAINCLAFGGQGGLPTLDLVEEFLTQSCSLSEMQDFTE